MPISTEELEGGITRVILEGRLDIEGAAAVDMRMNVIAGTKKAVIVDLQKVSFLGSMGLRALVAPARAIKGRGGKIVILRSERAGRKGFEDERRGHHDPHPSRTSKRHRRATISLA